MLFVGLLSLSGSYSYAGTALNASIVNIEGNAQGQFLIWLSVAMSNSPSCAVAPKSQVIVDGNTVGGRIMISVAESAYAMGQPVWVTGTNTCDIHSGYESVSDISTQ
jgi:hypothetical protein